MCGTPRTRRHGYTPTGTKSVLPAAAGHPHLARLSLSSLVERVQQHCVVSSKTMIVYASITRFENCTVFCESTVSGMEGNFAVVSSKLLHAFRSLNSLPDGARRTLVHRNSSSHNGSSSSGTSTRAVEVEGIRIPFCTQGLVWGTDSWFGDDPLDDPSLVQVDAYFHILREDGVVYLSLTNEFGKPTL